MPKDMIKKKKTMADRMPLILAFLLPVIIMVGICIGKGVWPFGSNTFLRTDLYHQYCPFYTELANRLKEGRSLTYAWDIGLGTNYAALAAYYLACPTMLLLYIVPESLIIEYITLMIILKIGFAGYTMAKYLSVKHKTNSLTIVIFGLMYSLCGYYAAYSWNIMWLDVLMLAPLVILGLEKLVKEDKPILYCITLALSIMTNYYLSIMLCIFAVIYFVGLLIMHPAKGFKANALKIFRFALYSLVGGAVAAVLVLPAYFALSTTASSNFNFPTELTSYFSVFEMISKQLCLVEVETGLDHWPNIYCGVAALLLLPLYYMNKEVPAREKIVKTVILAIMLLSFSFNIPNYIWHGLHFPNSLPARQSYLYTILLLSMGYEGLQAVKKVSKGQIVGTFAGVAAFVLLAEVIVDKEELGDQAIYVSLIFLAMYALYMYLYNTGRLKKETALILGITVLIVELGINTAVTSVRTTDRDVYTFDKSGYQTLLNEIDDDGFYRVEKETLRTKNDGAWIGYNSASLFSSTTPKGISDIYKKLGMEGNTNAYAFTGATPFTASILSVKYILSRTELTSSNLYSLEKTEDGAYLYKNNYTLPLGFVVPSDMDDSLSASATNAISYQNSFASLAAGENINLFDEINGETSGGNFTITADKNEWVYVKINNSSIKDVTVTVGSNTKTYNNVDRGFLVNVGELKSGESAVITSKTEDQTLTATAYAFDEDEFIKFYNDVSPEGFKLDQFNNSTFDTSIYGSVDSTKDGYLYMSIPYEEGWSVKVNGEEVTCSSLDDAFILIPVTKGHNSIEMTYSPKGFKTGLLITNGGLVLLIILVVIDRKRRHPFVKDDIKALEGGKGPEPKDEQIATDGEDSEPKKEIDIPIKTTEFELEEIDLINIDKNEVTREVNIDIKLEPEKDAPHKIDEGEIQIINLEPRAPIDSRNDN